VLCHDACGASVSKREHAPRKVKGQPGNQKCRSTSKHRANLLTQGALRWLSER